MKRTLLTVMMAGAVAASEMAACGQEYSSLSITYQPAGTTNDGTALTNAIAAGTTLAVMSDPIGLTRYDSCAIQWEFNTLTNTAPLGCTNVLTFGASSDGVVFTATNAPFLTLTVVVPPTSTNGVLVTNVPASLLGSIGYLQLQTMQNPGTNTTTNHSVLIWRKPKRNG